MSHISEETIDELRALQAHIGEANDAKGFHLEGLGFQLSRAFSQVAYKKGDEPPVVTDEQRRTIQQAMAAVRNYWTSRLALITTEVAEAIEELRHGRAVDETYYPSAPLGGNATHETGAPAKPEGVPSELADIVIRAFDFAYEANIDLASMINEKLAYNATRAHKHGKEF